MVSRTIDCPMRLLTVKSRTCWRLVSSCTQMQVIRDLKEKGYDAVIIAVRAHRGSKPNRGNDFENICIQRWITLGCKVG